MRYFRYAFWAIVAICLITVGLANREFVTLRLLPEEVARVVGNTSTIDLPLFVVIFGGVVAGLLIGFVWEWLREYKFRAAASRRKTEVTKLEREVTRLREESPEAQDDVLALLEDSARTR